MCHVQAGRVTVQIRILDQTFLTVKAERSIKSSSLVTSGSRHLVVLIMSGSDQFFPPVRISQFRYPCICINIGVCICFGRLKSLVYCRVVKTFINHFTALFTVQCGTEVDSCIRKASAGAQSNFSPPYRSFFGSDQNHPVRGTRTVKRSGGGILYHCNILDIGRIKSTHHICFRIVHIGSIGPRTGSHTAGSDRYTVNHKKRFIGCIE